MLYLFADINLTADITITQITQVSDKKIQIYVKDTCILVLTGDYQNTNESNLMVTLKKNNFTKQKLIAKINNFKKQQMCPFIYNDDVLQNANSKLKINIGWPFFISYSTEELSITKGPKIPFPIPYSANIDYQDATGYRIYLPKGPVKAIMFDIYGGGIDRLYYPFIVPSDEIALSSQKIVMQYKKFFRYFLNNNIAVVTLRLADCRLSIKDPWNLDDKNKPFLYRSNQNRLLAKHQSFYIEEINLIKKEIKNFLDQLPIILKDTVPNAKDIPKIFIGMSFGGVVGLFIAQNPASENWFDYYVLMQTPTYEFKGVTGDTIYDILDKITYLKKNLFFIFGETDTRIGDGREHITFFLKRILNKDLVHTFYMKGVGHALPDDPTEVAKEILKFCGVSENIIIYPRNFRMSIL